MTLKTEDDAKDMHCPISMARADGPDSLGGPYRCLGTTCMAWRWAEFETYHRRFKAYGGPDRHERISEPRDARGRHDVPAGWTWTGPEEERPGGWYEPEAEAKKRRRGYCGMAGGLPAHAN